MLPVGLRNNKIPINCPQYEVLLGLESRHLWNFLRIQILLINSTNSCAEKWQNYHRHSEANNNTDTDCNDANKEHQVAVGGRYIQRTSSLDSAQESEGHCIRQTQTWVVGMPPINFNFVFTALLRNLQFIVLSSTTTISHRKSKSNN